jgi:NADPH:quinone reductase-like Zn-dependent oxidoreductase
MPEDGLVATMPAKVSFEEAAAGTEGSHYALWFIRKAKVRSGQDVLVNGATGAVGSAAVQLLKSMGAEVTAVCETKNMGLVRGLGADRSTTRPRTSPRTLRPTMWSWMRWV